MPLLDIESDYSESNSDGESTKGKCLKMIDLDKSALSDTMLLVHHDQEIEKPTTKYAQISETTSLFDDNKVEILETKKARKE